MNIQILSSVSVSSNRINFFNSIQLFRLQNITNFINSSRVDYKHPPSWVCKNTNVLILFKELDGKYFSKFE